MTDNGSCYRAFDFRDACRELGLRHVRTRPYTPKTNGKAERFIQTALRLMGLRQAIRALRSTKRAAAHLAASIQLASTPRPIGCHDPNQLTRPSHGQPVDAPQLRALALRRAVRPHWRMRNNANTTWVPERRGSGEWAPEPRV